MMMSKKAGGCSVYSIGITGRSSNKRGRSAESYAHTGRMEVAVHYHVDGDDDDDVRLTGCTYMASGWCG